MMGRMPHCVDDESEPIFVPETFLYDPYFIVNANIHAGGDEGAKKVDYS